MKVVVPPKAAARPPGFADCARIAGLSAMLKWTCASMPPGTTYFPRASIIRFAVKSIEFGAAKATMRPFLMPTSNCSLVCGDTTVPPRIKTSSMSVFLPQRVAEGLRCVSKPNGTGVAQTSPAPPRSTPPPFSSGIGRLRRETLTQLRLKIRVIGKAQDLVVLLKRRRIRQVFDASVPAQLRHRRPDRVGDGEEGGGRIDGDSEAELAKALRGKVRR